MRFIIGSTVALCAATLGGSAFAQATATTPYVLAVGQATVSVQPDEVQIDFSVLTTATTAQTAASQNATQTNTLIAALQHLLGTNGNVQTVSYSLSPNYNYPPNGGSPVLTGFTASNTVQVTATDLSMSGTIIDTGVTAGATTVTSLQFTLQNPDPSLQQALKAATAQAQAHASAMASGVGMHAGAVISIQQNVATSITPVNVTPGTTAVTTPVLPGLVNIQATVTLQVTLTM